MAHAKQRPSGSVERPSLDNFPTDLSGASKQDLLDLSRRFGVDFIRLQFTDIMGINKNVEVPRSQFEKALDGEIMFDGSSIAGWKVINESDMKLIPDPATAYVDTFGVEPAVRRPGDLHRAQGAARETRLRLPARRGCAGRTAPPPTP